MDPIWDFIVGMTYLGLGLAILCAVGYMFLRAYWDDWSRGTMGIRVAGGFIGWLCAGFLLWQGLSIVLKL